MSVWCDRTLIRCPMHFGLCTTEESFHRELRRLKLPRKNWPDFVSNWHSDATTHHFEKRNDKKVAVIVCIRTGRRRTFAQVAALLTHEAIHIWQSVREYMGENTPSTEFEAWSVQSITQELLESYAAQRRKKAKPRKRGRR